MNMFLDRFIDAYHKWSTDHTIQDVSSEFAFYLKRKETRLKEKGLEIEEDFAHVKDEIGGTISKEQYPYIAKIEYREAKHHLKYFRNGKIIKQYKEPVNVYGTVLDKFDDRDEEVICPNCGHPSKRSLLGNGCPYCKTYFELPPTYPYVTSFYSVPGVVERATLMDKVKVITLVPAIIVGLTMFALYMRMYSDVAIIFRLLISCFYAVFMGGLTAFVVYLGYSFLLLLKLFIEAGRALPLLSGLKTKKKVLEKMREYDQDFSYEYFEGRVITLLRQICFSNNYKELSIYRGDDDLSSFQNLIDISYRGASKLLDLKEVNGILKLTMKVFLTNTYYKNNIKRKDESFIVTIEKDAAAKELGHDLCHIKCQNCGGSFDGLHYKSCPYCNTPYDLVHDDWVISGIRKA